jgi:uncharacterized membrane protein YoaK (UPF0700 family)
MFVAHAHTLGQQTRLAVTLAWIAGYTNLVSIVVCGHAASHVSGTVSQWGLDVVQGQWHLAILTTFILIAFFAGAVLSGWSAEFGLYRHWRSLYILPMAIEAGLLALFAILIEIIATPVSQGPALYALIGTAALAMGLQNATITRISGGVVRTTHMTGVLTDLGLESARLACAPWHGDRSAAVRRSAMRRVLLLGTLLGSFALGAGLGAVAHAQFPRLVMFPPVLFLLWIVYQDARLPICEVTASTKENAELRAVLPDHVAIYTIVKDSLRSDTLHRLPDLEAWWDGLPEHERVVILDLGTDVQLGHNAPGELELVAARARLTSRRLIISGLSREAFLRLGGTASMPSLSAENVCPDLELAAARALIVE